MLWRQEELRVDPEHLLARSGANFCRAAKLTFQVCLLGQFPLTWLDSEDGWGWLGGE